MTSVVDSGPAEREREQSTLRVRIHRGATQIGGSCVELEHDGHRLVLDVGRPLDAARDEHVPLPDVPGLADGDRSLSGVVISHGHQDHWGLINQVHPDVPRYIGQAAATVLRAAQFWGSGVDIHETGHLHDRQPLHLGPFTVTPYLVDHSGFDAYCLLVDAGGRRIMYSGDLRGHGRKASLFERLVATPPSNVDALLLEGTHIGHAHDGHGLTSEAAVEAELAALCQNTAGAVVTLSSAQNIDRLVTCYRAALRSGRELVMDLYTAEIMAATGLATIPQPGSDWPKVHVFMPVRQRVRVRDFGDFSRTQRVREQRLYPEQIAADPGRYLLVGAYQGEVARMIRSESLVNGCVVWSLWDGYLQGAAGDCLRATLTAADVPLVRLHTSGHASRTDLRRLVNAVRPRVVVPIHTDSPDAYGSTFGSAVALHPDGQWWAA